MTLNPHQWEKIEVQDYKCKKAYLGDISPPWWEKSEVQNDTLKKAFLSYSFNSIQFHECGWPEFTPSSQVKEERDRKGHPSVVCITLQCISRTDVVNITYALNLIILKICWTLVRFSTKVAGWYCVVTYLWFV